MATATAVRPTTTESCDLRDWLKEVKRLEQLEQISGAHWDLEIGALTEIILERISTPPAVIFDKFQVLIPTAACSRTCSKPWSAPP